MEVGPLSRGVMLRMADVRSQPLSDPLQTAFASSIILYPHPYRHPLRFAFPVGEIRV